MTDHRQIPPIEQDDALAEYAEDLKAIESTMCRAIGVMQVGDNRLVMKLLGAVSLQQAALRQLGVESDPSDRSH